MFDIGFWEMSMIGLIALIVLGPERLPKVARTAGLWIGRARRMVADVKADINREIKASELKELQQSVAEAGKDVKDTFADVGASAEDLVSEVSPTGRSGKSGSGKKNKGGVNLEDLLETDDEPEKSSEKEKVSADKSHDS